MIRTTIKEALKLRKVKAVELAESIGVAKSTMSLFLNNKINLGQDKIEAIFRFLDISLLINDQKTEKAAK